VIYHIGEEEIRLTPSIVQQYIVGSDAKITMSEFKMFTELCKIHQLNPFLKEAYCIKYGQKPAAIVIGKDAFLKRAGRNPAYDGKESGVIVTDKNGTIVERIGCFVHQSETLVGGWCKVFRKDRQYPEYVSVCLNECLQRKSDGSTNVNWQSKPATMIEKVAKVRALREAFPENLQGLYEADEIDAGIPDAPQEPYVTESAPPAESVQDASEDIQDVDMEAL
jgi:phage recombination protein Bet